MDLDTAKTCLLRTHLAALRSGHRANTAHMQGPPGIGKTEIVFQYCAALAAATKRPVGLVQFMLATVSSVDVRGFMLPTKGPDGMLQTIFSTPPWYPGVPNAYVVEPDGTWHFPGAWTGEVPDVGVLFMDEFSQADDDVKKPAAELVYKGEVGTVRLPDWWRVITAGNRMQDRSGVMRELMFIVNRRVMLDIEASLPVFLDYQNKLPLEHKDKLHYLALSFAQKNPDIVFRDSVPDGSDPYCTPRSLCMLNADLMALRSADDAKANRLPLDAASREWAAGLIGKGSAGQFYSHLKYADDLPDMADVERNPGGAKVPPNKDAQMVAAYMLAHNITEANAGHVIRYMERLHTDMQVLMVRTLSVSSERVKAVVSNPAYTKWLMANKDLIIAARQ